MKKLLFLLLTAVSCWLPQLHAQVTISAEDLVICSGGTVSVDISVTNFSNVNSMSFPINWNPAVLQYTGQTISLPPVSGVNNSNAASGQLLFSWFDPNGTPAGLSLPNSTTILTVHFNVLGNYISNNFTTIALTGGGFPSEVYTNGDVNNPDPTAVFDSGSVSIADSQNPTFSGCPPTVTVTGQTATWTPPVASDNCMVASVTSNYSPGATFPPGTTIVTYTATDGAGNMGTCSFPVTVVGSQLTFIATNDTLGCGDTTVQVQVRVTNFNNVSGFQFGLAFDTSLLNFTTAAIASTFPPSSTLNVDSAGVGQIRFAWFDATPPLGDVTLPANTLVLTLNFVIDNPGVDSAGVEFASFPTFFMLFLDQNGNTIPMNGVTLIDSEILIESDDPPTFITCPGNISVNAAAGQCGATVTWAVPTATDDCDNPPTIVRTLGAAPGSFFSVGTQTIRYVATDSLNQKDTCQFTVTVIDNQLPSITCPASQSLANTPGVCGAAATWTIPTPTDNCPGVTASPSHAPGSTFPVGTTTVTYTATDASNNQSTCSFTITVTDQQSPTLGPCPANVTQSADSGVCQTTVTWTTPPASDNCTLVSLTPSIPSGSSFPVGTTTVTYTATDQASNVSTCSFTVTVTDNQIPSITCPVNVTVSNTAGQCDGIATWTAPTPTDNCPGVTATPSHASGSTFPLGTTTVTYAAIDASNNIANCTFTVTVEDDENPSITCPANVSVSNTLGQCDGIATWTVPTPTDNCLGVTATPSHASGSTFPLGTTTVTYTATDAANNTATCTFTVTVEDDENPSITCPANVSVSNTLGQCDGVATWTAPTPTDNCPGVTSSASHASGSTFPLGTTTVTYTATDAANNTATCTFTVTVEDDENPSITCPANVSVSNTLGQCDGVATWTAPTPTDNCPGVTATPSHASGSTFPVGTTTVTYTATDVANNTANCTFTVTVEDDENPVITCPANVSVSNTLGQCNGTATWTVPTPSDNCPGATASASHAPGSTFPVGTTTVTYTATDAANNTATCTFTVTVEDDENPVITCPANVSVSNTLGQCTGTATWTAPTPSDNCPGATANASHAPGSTFPVGTTTVTYTATDAASNTATCTFTVTVTEDEDPVIVCPANISINNTAGQCDGVATWTAPIPSDNCPGVTASASHAPGSTFPVGTTTVTYTATDAANNTATCSFTVTVTDTEAPVIGACPANISQGNEAGLCGATVFFNAPTATDNCALASVLASPAPGDFFLTGTTTVTYTATDAANNTATCQFTVTVTDDEAPTIADCPLLVQVPTDTGACDAIVVWTEPTATDNCQLLSFVADYLPLDTFPIGTFTVTYTATDTAGNVTVCAFDVVVADQEPPTIVNCPANITMDNIAGQCTAKVVWTPPTSFDNCPGDTLISSHVSGSLFNVGTTTVTYQAIDSSGNDFFCFFDVTVLDVEPPVFSGCPTDSVVSADSACQAVVFWTEPVADDNCPTVLITRTHEPGDTFPTGTTTVLYVATDAGGNTDSCSFNITVEDDTPPEITGCPGDISVGTDSSFCAAAVDWVEPLASDNCLLANFTTTHSPLDVFLTDTTTVTYTATDDAGNVTTCEFEVVVADDDAPVIANCPLDTFVVAETDSCSAIVNWSPLTVTENCPGFTLVSNFDPGDRFPVDTTFVNYVATDAAGNSATCSFMVVVMDTILPVFVNCPADINVPADSAACDAEVTWTAPTVEDDCDVEVTTSHDPGDKFPVGTTTVTYHAEDAGWNQKTCIFTVTVVDDQSPVLVCPPNDTFLIAPTDTAAIVNGIGLVSLDENCALDSTWFTLTGDTAGGAGTGSGTIDASGTSFKEGTTTVTYFAEDESGNVSSCSFIIEVIGFVPIDLECPAPVQTVTDTGECSAVVLNLTPIITPVDSLANLDYVATGATSESGNDASGLPFAVGLTTVTYTATDHAGNVYTCSFTVEVEDDELPVFTNCGGNDTLSTSNTMCGLLFSGSVLPVATDNCPGLTVTYLPAEGTFLTLGTTAVSALATDSAGNQAICTYNITVVDDDAPVISNCPANISVAAAAGQCGANVNWIAPTATDNCQLLAFTPSQAPGSFFPAGNIPTPVEYVAVDNAGNVAKCQFTVTVQDQQAPVVTCPGNVTVNAAPNLCSAFVTWALPSATDNCAVVSLTGNQTPGSFEVGSYTATYTAVDAAGNSGNCSFTITVVDNQFPVFSGVPQDIVVLAEPGLCGATVTWTPPTASDNCGIIAITSNYAPGSFFDASGEVEVEYTAVDENGNATVVSFTVEVVDVVPPAFNCPADVTISTDGNIVDDPSGVITNYQAIDCQNIQLDYLTPSVSDDCGISSVVQTQGLASGSIFTVGSTSIIFVATDNNGTPNACQFDIVVEAPAAVAIDAFPTNPCEGDAVFFFVNDYQGATYEWKDPLGNVVATESFFNLSAITMLQSGTFTLEIDLPSNCTLTGSVDVIVNPNPQVTATANDLLCTDGTGDIQLSANVLNGADVVEWTWVYPDQTFAFGQNQTISDAGLEDAGMYSVTAMTANGCLGFATVEVDVSLEPVMPALFGDDNAVCVGEQVVLDGQAFVGDEVEYVWFAVPAQGSGLIPFSNDGLTVEPSEPGTYIYYYQVVVDGCISDTAEWVVNVQAYPTLDPTVDGELACVDGTTSITLNANATGDVDEWSWEGATTTFSSDEENPVILNATSDDSDIYEVTATTTNGCSATAELAVVITDAPQNPTLTGTPANVCVGTPINLTATGNYPPGTQFIWTGNNLPPSAPFLQNLQLTPDATGTLTYTFQALVDGCSTTVASVNVSVEEELAVSVEIDGTTTCVAAGSTVTLLGSPSGAASYEWRKLPGNTVIGTQSTLVLTNLTASSSGVYSLTVFSNLGCAGMGTIELNVTEALPELIAAVDGSACEEGNLTLCANPLTGATFLWQNPQGQIFADTRCVTLPNASPGMDGTYTVTATLDGCQATGSVPVEVLTTPVALAEEVLVFFGQTQSFDVVANDTLQEGRDYTITLLEQPTKGTLGYVGNGVFNYTPNDAFMETDRLVYEICYTDCPDLCDIALVTLQLRYPATECVITSVISPNDDGINDALVVSCLDEKLEPKPNNRIVIFNQWGDKVYEAQPYKNDWKGTYKDGHLPDGTYFYLFQVDPAAPEQKGFVMIYR